MGVVRYTINDVKNFLEEHDVDHTCTLLSTSYEKGSVPLLFRCNICGEEFSRPFYNLKRAKRYCCEHCSSSIGHRSISLDTVKKYLDTNDVNHDCTLLSKEYKSSSSNLTFRCNLCGQEFQRSYDTLKRAKYYCCQKCTIQKVGKDNVKYTPEFVDSYLAEYGCKLLEPYTNITTKSKCQCSKGHIFDFVLAQSLRKSQPCIYCSYEARRGPNSPHWKNGGNQETIDLFRHSLTLWKQEVLKKADYKCDICGEHTPDLVIHHASRNFSDIVQEASDNTNIPILPKISDYTDKDRETLINEIQRLHTVDIGRVITRDYHKKFHHQYGTHNNTLEQYKEFKKQEQEKLRK